MMGRRRWSKPGIARALVLALMVTLATAAPLAGTLAQDAGEPVTGGTLRIT
jgi:hypothetical protein